MNLHEIGNDILIDYLYWRFPGYDFVRTGASTIIFRYKPSRWGNEPSYGTIQPENYRNYDRHAVEWQARGRS